MLCLCMCMLFNLQQHILILYKKTHKPLGYTHTIQILELLRYFACCTNSIRKFQLHDLNARLTMNVLHTLHASVKNVKIRAKPIHVASTLNVWLGIIEPFVSASMDMLAILLQFVKNVSYTQKIMFWCPFRQLGFCCLSATPIFPFSRL